MVWMAIAAVVAGFALYVSKRPMDFRVYHYGARGVFDGTRPVYGPASGLGWPMHYRYPPLFLLLFAPFAWLPLGASAALWLMLKFVVLIFLVRAIWNKLPPAEGTTAWLVPLLFAGPYVVQEFRYGNAQFFVFALSVWSLLLVKEKPVLAGAALALAIAIKVWPLALLPFLLLQSREAAKERSPGLTAGATLFRRFAASIVLFTLILTILPSLYFGFRGNLGLLGEWFNQEFATQTGEEEIWFPSQSLRGVMMRYLTSIDYSHVPDSNYRQVNITGLSPTTVRTAWFVASAAIYLGFLVLTYRRGGSSGWIGPALAFCLIALLEPFTQKYALVILLFPAIVAGRLTTNRMARNLIYVGIGLVWIQNLIPGSTAQRWMQVLGLDFAAALPLTVALGWVSFRPASAVTTYSSSRHILVTPE